MRNWNYGSIAAGALSTVGLYRTYEELKQEAFAPSSPSPWCLYRTYEELKHPASAAIFFMPAVAFVSYLWGIETEINISNYWYINGLYRTYEELKLKAPNPKYNGVSAFVSYLWGIETV